MCSSFLSSFSFQQAIFKVGVQHYYPLIVQVFITVIHSASQSSKQLIPTQDHTQHTHINNVLKLRWHHFAHKSSPPFSVDTPLIKMSLKGCFLFFNLRRTQKAKFVTVVKMVYLRRVCNQCRISGILKTVLGTR